MCQGSRVNAVNKFSFFGQVPQKSFHGFDHCRQIAAILSASLSLRLQHDPRGMAIPNAAFSIDGVCQEWQSRHGSLYVASGRGCELQG
jgi:hypothetical protein